MHKIVILHFQPIELYPPIQNLMRALANQASKDYIFYVLTTQGNFSELDLFIAPATNIKIIRLGNTGSKLSTIYKWYNYVKFYAGSLLQLICTSPQKIFYYETLSSLAPYLYKRFIDKNVPVFIHYHEYTSKNEYETGMTLSKKFHHFEKYLYPNAVWISHTNEYRMQLFKNDITPIIILNSKIYANYPPKHWIQNRSKEQSAIIKIVYVGALSMDTMYTREFATWVQSQDGKIIWDIYSYNCTEAVKNYFNLLNSTHISLREGVNYSELPSILYKYDVGVILYNGHSENYIYNAPNKLFEYLTCGLACWYPEQIKGCYEYDFCQSSLNVLRLNFENLQTYKLESMINIEASLANFSFSAETESAEIIRLLLMKN